MTDLPAVLAANESFYSAFNAGDFTAMGSVWAQSHPVACLHPGWSPVTGRDQVLATWQAILANSGGTSVQCVEPQAFPLGDSAFVICYERLPRGRLIATNLFVLENGIWRMVHHQAGPAPATPPAQTKPIQAPGTRTLQ